MKLHKPLLMLLLLCGIATVSFAQTATPGTSDAANLRDVNLKGDVKTVIKGISHYLSLSVVFDESVKASANVDIQLKDVTLEKTLQIVLTLKSLRACWTEDNTILVYADTPELRERFAQYKLWEPKSKESK